MFAGSDDAKGLPVIIEEMTSLLGEARQQSWSYEWMPLSGIVSLVALVATVVLRPLGRFAVAFDHLQPALDFLESDLKSRGIFSGVWPCLTMCCCQRLYSFFSPALRCAHQGSMQRGEGVMEG